MSYTTNKKDLTEGFHVGSQTPIDDRLVFADLVALADLGTDNDNAYKYYEGMRVWCLSNDLEYVWKESGSGVLGTSFTYPAGVTAGGINYGGRAFNFVQTVNAPAIPSPVLDRIEYTVSLIAETTNVINVGNTIDAVHVYYNNEDITGGIQVERVGTDLHLTSNVALANVKVNVIYS